MECPFELPVEKTGTDSIFCEIRTKKGTHHIAELIYHKDADYIVQAINSHEKLVEQKEKLTLELLAIDHYCRANDIDIEQALEAEKQE